MEIELKLLVARDDLEDGGARIWASAMSASTWRSARAWRLASL